MAGSGRSFEPRGFLSKLDEVRGYVLSDIESFPRVPYWAIEAGNVRSGWARGLLGAGTKISRAAALTLLGDLD
jgi:hypothetical protein